MKDLFDQIDFETFSQRAQIDERSTGYGKGTSNAYKMHSQTITYNGKQYARHFDAIKIPTRTLLKQAYARYLTEKGIVYLNTTSNEAEKPTHERQAQDEK